MSYKTLNGNDQHAAYDESLSLVTKNPTAKNFVGMGDKYLAATYMALQMYEYRKARLAIGEQHPATENFGLYIKQFGEQLAALQELATGIAQQVSVVCDAVTSLKQYQNETTTKQTELRDITVSYFEAVQTMLKAQQVGQHEAFLKQDDAKYERILAMLTDVYKAITKPSEAISVSTKAELHIATAQNSYDPAEYRPGNNDRPYLTAPKFGGFSFAQNTASKLPYQQAATQPAVQVSAYVAPVFGMYGAYLGGDLNAKPIQALSDGVKTIPQQQLLPQTIAAEANVAYPEKESYDEDQYVGDIKNGAEQYPKSEEAARKITLLSRPPDEPRYNTATQKKASYPEAPDLESEKQKPAFGKSQFNFNYSSSTTAQKQTPAGFGFAAKPIGGFVDYMLNYQKIVNPFDNLFDKRQ